MTDLSVYLPIDRRIALEKGLSLPEQDEGTALFADLSGFTPLTERLVGVMGARRGAEEITKLLNQLYDMLIITTHSFDGAVIGFNGDAILCWFSQDNGRCAITAALEMQRRMALYETIALPDGKDVHLALKIGVASGAVRRFVVGDEEIQKIDLLMGETLIRMAQAEAQANRGEIILSAETAAAVAESIIISEWREHEGGRFALVRDIRKGAQPKRDIYYPKLPANIAEKWLLKPIVARINRGQRQFLAEIRPAAVLFLKFTHIDYDHPESAVQLDQFVSCVQRKAAEFGGYLISVSVGDKGSYLYLSFGSVRAFDDNRVRALATSFELLHLDEQFSFLQPLQIGIAAGQLYGGACGNGWRQSYTLMGDKVNLAARLMELAPPGTIRCDNRIYQAVNELWEIRSLTPVAVKGKASLVRVYEPTGRKVRRQRKDGSPSHQMVGRVYEKEQLGKCLTALGQNRSSVVLLEGEGGIGKSRLVAELALMIRRVGEVGLIGAGQSIEQTTPYRAWRDIIDSYFNPDLSLAIAEHTELVLEKAKQVIPKMEDRYPLLNDLLGTSIPETALTSGFSPEQRQQNLTILILALLRGWAAERPLILIIEDAHWLDQLSWQLLLDVIYGLQASRHSFFITVVSRPVTQYERVADSISRLRAIKLTQHLPLANLTAEEIRLLIHNRINIAPDTLPEALIELIQSRSNGNPFFAEELILTLKEQKILQLYFDEQTDLNQPKIDADWKKKVQSLPDNLQGIILSRIDRLPPERQLVLKIAAVIGRTFAFAPLHHTINRYAVVATSLLEKQLLGLTDHQLTFLEARDPDLTYIFKHIITQEVTYQTLLFEQRKEIHLAVARWYEAEFSEKGALAPYYPLLVYHYHQAQDEAEERAYAILAGKDAARRFAHETAVVYLTRALELLQDDSELTQQLLSLRAESYHHLSNWDAYHLELNKLKELGEAENRIDWILDALGRAIRHKSSVSLKEEVDRDLITFQAWAEKREDLYHRAQYYAIQGEIDSRRHEHTKAEGSLQKALSLAEANQFSEIKTVALMGIGSIAYDQLRFEEARTYYLNALDTLYSADQFLLEAEIYNGLGRIHSWLEKYEESQRYYEQALAIYQKIGNRHREAGLFNNLAIVFQATGHGEQAYQHYLNAYQVYEEMGDLDGMALIQFNLGIHAHELFAMMDALTHYKIALSLYQQLNDHWMIGETISYMGISALFCGNFAQAADWLKEGAIHLAQTEHDRFKSQNLCWQAQLALVSGRFEEGLQLVEEGIVAAPQIGSMLAMGFALYTKVLLLLATNQIAEAAQILPKARQLIEEDEGGINGVTIALTISEAEIALRQKETDKATALLGKIDQQTILDHFDHELLFLPIPYWLLTIYQQLVAQLMEEKREEIDAIIKGSMFRYQAKLVGTPYYDCFIDAFPYRKKLLTAND